MRPADLSEDTRYTLQVLRKRGYQRSELDWLIYNKPLEYAQLVLGGGLKEYLNGTPEHRLTD